MLIYWLWKTGHLTNVQVGNIFSLTYSAISHSVKVAKKKMRSDKRLRAKFEFLNSKFKL
jgi:hypothetical protein